MKISSCTWCNALHIVLATKDMPKKMQDLCSLEAKELVDALCDDIVQYHPEVVSKIYAQMAIKKEEK